MIQIIIKADLKATEKRIDEKIQALNDGVHEAGYILKDEIVQSIHGNRAEPTSVDLGFYGANVDVDVSKPFQTTVFTNVEYAKFLEFGTSPHFISPKTKKALRWKVKNEVFFSKGHMVSGIKPRRHFANSSIRMKPVIVQYIEDKIKVIQ